MDMGQNFTAKYISDGRYVPYTPSGDTPAGSVVVQGTLVGVVVQDIPAGRQGDLCIEGVIRFNKATTAGSGFTAGSRLYWDATNLVATPSDGGGANQYIGKNFLAAADADATVLVRFHPL